MPTQNDCCHGSQVVLKGPPPAAANTRERLNLNQLLISAEPDDRRSICRSAAKV